MTTFSRDTVVEDITTGLVTRVVTTITGSAIELSRGEGGAYDALGLVVGDDPLLLFTPDTYGATIQVGDRVGWPTAATQYTVRHVRHLRPDGVTIYTYAIISR